MLANYLIFILALNFAPASPSNLQKQECSPATFQIVRESQPSLASLGISIEERAASRLRLNKSIVITEPCGSQINRAIAGQFLLMDGRVLQIDQSDVATFRDFNRSAFSIPENSKNPPLYLGVLPKQTVQIEGNLSIRSKFYIGLWSIGGQSILASFVEKDGKAMSPIPIISSNRKIVGIGYFPAPDTSSGGISLIQRNESGAQWTSLIFNSSGWEKGL